MIYAAADPAPSLSFGVSLGAAVSAQEIRTAATSAEQAGFDVLTAADHIGRPAPFAVLAVAASVTARIRLSTYVLDAGFWNPGLLAREVATLDALSGGRFELGLGSGHLRREHEDVGLRFAPPAERIRLMAATVAEVRRRLSDPSHLPATVQRPVPVLVGGMSEAGLRVAAEQADVVALSGLFQVPGRPAGTFTLASSSATDERVALVRRVAGVRRPMLDALLQQVVLGAPPEQSAAAFSAQTQGAITAEQVLDSPFVLYAESAAAAVQELLRRRRRWGITRWSTHAPSAGVLASVIAELRG